MNSVPAYFKFRRDFDYGQFLEQRSHANEIALKIESETDRIVGHEKLLNNDLQKALISVGKEVNLSSEGIERSIDGITQTLNQGFTQISFDLNALTNSVERLDETIFDGFVSVTSALDKTNTTLERIAVGLESPGTVWAEEQFSMARRAAEVSITDMALKHVELAINGDASHTGVPIDPRFHFFRGMLLSGAVCGTELLNLSDAVDAFKAAARCAGNDKVLKKQALAKASWSAYCAGILDDALMLALEAATIKTNYPMAEFYAAKFLFELDKIEAARPYLITAIERDPKLALRLDNDESFQKERKRWLAWLESARKEETMRLLSFYTERYSPEHLDQLLSLTRLCLEESQFSHLKKLRTKIIGSLNENSDLGVLKIFKTQLVQFDSDIREEIKKCLSLIEMSADRFEEILPRVANVANDDSVLAELRRNTPYARESSLPWLGAIVSGGIGAYFAWNNGDAGISWFIGLVIVGAIMIPLMGSIGYFVGYLMREAIHSSRVSGQEPAVLERHHSERHRVEKANDAERERVKDLKEKASRIRSDLPNIVAAFHKLFHEELSFTEWKYRVS